MDFLESFSSLHRLLQIGSLSQLQLERKSGHIQRSRLLEIYTICIIILSLALLFYGLFGNDDFTKTNTNEIGQTVDYIQLIGIRVAHVISILESLLRRSDQKLLLEKVCEIDRIFECSLNVSTDNGDFRRRIKQRGSLMFIVYIACELFILGTMYSTVDRKFSLYWIFYLMPFLICGLRYFQIFITIMYIKCRFDKLLMILEEINLRRGSSKLEHSTTATLKLITQSVPVFETAERINRRFDMENPELKKLLVIRDLYNRLWELSGIVNRCFGLSMLINVGNDFLSITSNCYWIFLNFNDYSSTLADFMLIASSAVWSVPHLCNVLVLAVLCDRTVQRTTNIALGVHRIEIDNLNDNHNTVIEQFSLQLLHQKLAFTAAGFFNLDSTLLYTIVGSTTTYLIILIQFHMNESNAK